MNTHRRCRASKGQAEQHEQRNELVSRFHIGHTQCAVMTTVPYFGWLQNVCQLQEVKGDHGRCNYWQLRERGRERERAEEWSGYGKGGTRVMRGGISQHLKRRYIHKLLTQTALGLTYKHLGNT